MKCASFVKRNYKLLIYLKKKFKGGLGVGKDRTSKSFLSRWRQTLAGLLNFAALTGS